jgi:hypothetical protein
VQRAVRWHREERRRDRSFLQVSIRVVEIIDAGIGFDSIGSIKVSRSGV